MKQCGTYLGLQTLSLFDMHIFKGDSGKDYTDTESVRGLIEDNIDLENAELREIRSNPLLSNRLRVRKHPDGTIITSAYNLFPNNDEQERANMLAVASSVSAVASLQATLIAAFGTTLGGSMAFGGVHNDATSTWGDAVDKAIALKAERSEVYPRMTVSDEIGSLFEDLCARQHVRTDGRFGNAIEYDADGVPFINYLSAQFILERIRGVDEGPHLLTAMMQHQQGIERMIGWGGDSIRSDEILKKRYEWLISYHNRTVLRSGIGERIDPAVLDRI